MELAARAAALARDGAPPEAIREAVVAARGGRSLCDGEHLCYYPDVWRSRPGEAAAC